MLRQKLFAVTRRTVNFTVHAHLVFVGVAHCVMLDVKCWDVSSLLTRFVSTTVVFV